MRRDPIWPRRRSGSNEVRYVAAIEQHSHGMDRGRKSSSVCESKRIPATQRQTRLTESQCSELAELYLCGWSVKRLAERFRIHKGTVSGHLERAGVPRRGWQRRMSDRQVEEASRLYVGEERWSLARLGRHFGVAAMTVRKELIEAGVELRPAR